MSRLPYPLTRRDDDVVQVLHGHEVRDPYRWLEADSPEVKAWEAAQNALAEAVLGIWPERDRLYRAVRDALLRGNVGSAVPSFGGNLAFRLGPKPGGQYPVLWVSEADSRAQWVLVDPNQMGEGAALDWFYPSPNGEYVAYGVSHQGDEQSVLHIAETRTGRVLPERLFHTSFARLAWLPDCSGFYYSGGMASDLEDAEKRLFFHRLGEVTARRPEPIRFHDPYISPQLSPDGRYLMVNVGWERPCAAYYKDLATGGSWRPLLRGKPGESYGAFDGDRFLALTTYGAPRGRIVAVPLATAQDESTWEEIVPESEAVLRHFALVNGRLAISELWNAHSRLRIRWLTDGSERTVPLPGMGLIEAAGALDCCPFSVCGQTIYFEYTTFTTPPRVYRYDLAADSLEPESTDAAPDLSHLRVQQLFYPSRDGARVSMYLVHRADLDLSQPHPTLLHGYGGWNIIAAPGYVGGTLGGAYVRCVLPFIEAGGIYAYANLRGGCEYGRDWWQAGRRETKQNTFDDLYAAAEHLIRLGVTAPDRLAVRGASNGGLLAAVAVTQRPDLFRAAVCEVPLTDMVRAFNAPYLAYYTEEYGDPQDPALLPVLLAYSPVHNVREGLRYPATLILCGSSDIRCQPWNGRKLAALLQQATSSEEPVLFKVLYGGHGPGLPLDAIVERHAAALAFIMQQLGMTVLDAAHER